MITIDLNKIREALPDRADVRLIKHMGKSSAIECKVSPPLSDSDFEMCKNWQREIIGQENIFEFYTEETGHHWFVYLKRIPIEFINIEDKDVNSFTGMKLVEGWILAK